MQQKQSQEHILALNNISRQINNLLTQRKKVLDSTMAHVVNARPEVSEAYNRQIISHFAQYSQIKKFVQEIIKNQSFFKTINDQSTEFWETNQKIQRDLQKRLKNLKQLDLRIDEMIQQQIQLAGQIQQIQQNIRSILSKKQPDHISRAEPLNTKKQSLISVLHQRKQAKQHLKQQKLIELTKILQILHQMKNIRRKRLQDCKQSFVSYNQTKQTSKLFQCLSKDIEQLVENRRQSTVIENNQKKMMLLVNQTNEKIQRLSRDLSQTFQTQQKALEQINKFFIMKSQITYFHQKLASFFQTNEQDIFSISQKFTKFVQIENQKNIEVQQVQQGINTTQDTIEIFQNLKHNIQTQTLRKRQLVDKISKLTKSYEVEKERRQVISEKQGRVQGLKINYNKLQTLLQQAAQQANVKQYKQIHAQLSSLSQSIKQHLHDLQKTKAIKRQAAKRIFSQTNSIQEQYRDLISQMFPQVWFRDQDFSKEQTINDFQIYLGKLFGRLKILA